MVNQIDTKIDFAPDTARHRNSLHARREHRIDSRSEELIAALANSYENQRARQVTEWERMRRQNLPIAA